MPIKPGDKIILASGPQPNQLDEDGFNFPVVPTVTAGIFASGFIKTKNGRMWDKYNSALRSIETGFPGAVLRTFRLSETTSVFETVDKMHITPDAIHSTGVYGEYLRKLIGNTSQGVTLTPSGIFSTVKDKNDKLVGYALNAASGTQRGEAIADYFARLSGVKVPEGFSIAEGALYTEWQEAYGKTGISFVDWKKWQGNRIRQPRVPLITPLRTSLNVFGQDIKLGEDTSAFVTKGENALTFLRARAATTVGRLNNLLKKPFEIPIVGGLLEKIPFVRSMAIEPGSATQMWGRYIKKGIQAGLIWKGLEYYDYLRAEEQPAAAALGTLGGAALGGLIFKNSVESFGKKSAVIGAAVGLYTAVSPRFEHGLFHGAASFVTDANLTRARFSDAIGLTDQLQSQNQITPGLITPGAAIAATGGGVLIGGLGSYGKMMLEASRVKLQKKLPFHEIVSQLRIERAEEFGEKWSKSTIGKKLSRLPGRLGEYLGKTKSPMLVGGMAGLATWAAVSSTAAVLSGNPLAAIPGLNLLGSDETEEQLQKWYSGEEEVPIRKGRFWEFGRSSSYSGGKIEYYRSHAMARLKARAYQKGIWGSEEDKWKYDPILHPLNAVLGSDEWKYAYEIKHQYDRPAPLCLHPDTPIFTKNGYKPISEVLIGDMVLNRLGNWTKVVNKLSRECNEGELIKIKISTDNRYLLTTPDHKILVIRNDIKESLKGGRCRLKEKVVSEGKLEWISAKKLKKSDLVVIPNIKTPVEFQEKIDLSEHLPYAKANNYLFTNAHVKQDLANAYISKLETVEAAKFFNVSYKRLWQARNRKLQYIDRYLTIDEDFAELLGWYIAEGWVGGKQGPNNLPSNVSFSLHVKEQYVVDFLTKYAKEKFNASVSTYKNSENGISVKIYSPVLSGLVESLLGETNAKNKIVPDFVFGWPVKLKQAFIRGVFRGDGHYKSTSKKQNGEITFISASSQLTMTLRILLLTIGIKSSFSKKTPSDNWKPVYINNRLIKKTTSYRLSISGYDKDLFSVFEKQTNFNTSNNRDIKGYLDDKYLYIPIRSIESINYYGDVYDLTVEEDNSFLSTCIVHNSSTYFQDIPFIGPLLAATVGKILKPRKFVRADEWMLGEGQYLHHPGRPESEPAYELGGLAPGAPVDPDSASQLFNELIYRRREAIGLVGFAEGAIQSNLTGREEYFENKQTFAVMGKETGSEYWLWKHLNLGGAAGSSEGARRFIPHKRSYLDEYNPLKTKLPSWFPKDYFMDYEHGNPFSSIKEAEIRLPGPGFVALHPELEGVDPENYSLPWRAKILGDVAMWSPEYRETMSYAWSQRNQMSEEHRKIVESTKAQVQAKKARREFDEYKFREEELSKMDVTVKEVLDPRTILTKEFEGMQVTLQGVGAVNNMTEAMEAARSNLEGKKISIYTPALESRRYSIGASGGTMLAVAMVGDKDYGQAMAEAGVLEAKELTDEFRQLRFTSGQKVAGSLGEAYSRAILTPLEFLTPVSPASKFYRHRSAIEEYISSEAVGSESAFWDKLLENFITPAGEMAEYKLGDKEIPYSVQKRRAITEYFDILQYVKEQKLAKEALDQNDYNGYADHLKSTKTTTFGVNPFATPSSVMMTLPRRERDFFSSFVEAKTEEDRQSILDLVPRDLQNIYLSQWIRQEKEAIVAKKDAGIATKEDDVVLSQIISAVKSEGIGHDEYLEDLWQKETGGKISFADWLRRRKLKHYFKTRSLPGPDWIGWCVPSWHEIITLNGLKLAENIKVNDMVKTINGWRKVLEVFKREVDEKLISIETYHNKIDNITATKNHLILTIKGNACAHIYSNNPCLCTERDAKHCIRCTNKHYKKYNLSWVPISNLSTDYFLPVPKLLYSDNYYEADLYNVFKNEKNIKISDNKISFINGPKKFIPRKIIINEDLAWLFGYFLAEGYILITENRMRGIGFTANLNEENFINKASDIIKNIFGYKSKTYKRYTKTGNSLNLIINNKLLCILFNSWVGRYCDKKHPPYWLEESPRSVQKALLEGLLDGDGSKDGRNTLILTNKELIYMAKGIFESIDIPVSVRKIIRLNKKIQWSIRPVLKTHVVIGKEFIAYRIKNISKQQYKGLVYDFMVDDMHMYSCNVGIFHNSPSVDLKDIEVKYVQNNALDYHEFDLWGDRVKSLARKPYLEDAEDVLTSADELTIALQEETEMISNAKMLDGFMGGSGSDIIVSRVNAGIGNKFNVQVQDSRSGLVKDTYDEMGVKTLRDY